MLAGRLWLVREGEGVTEASLFEVYLIFRDMGLSPHEAVDACLLLVADLAEVFVTAGMGRTEFVSFCERFSSLMPEGRWGNVVANAFVGGAGDAWDEAYEALGASEGFVGQAPSSSVA